MSELEATSGSGWEDQAAGRNDEGTGLLEHFILPSSSKENRTA